MKRFCPLVVLVAHDCGYPLSRYTCRATRVAADFLDFKAFCRCSTGVALHTPLKSIAPKFGSEKVSRYTGVSQLQLRVSRYTVQLSCPRGVRPGEGSIVQWQCSPGSLKALLFLPLLKRSTKQGDARGASEVRRGTASIHFHCLAARSSLETA